MGSGVLTASLSAGLSVDRNAIFRLASEMGRAMAQGLEVILVSSGAVAMGIEELALDKRPEAMARVQALAAIGQGQLMQLWRSAFERCHHGVGQVLLTHSDLGDRQRFLNVRATLDALLAYGAIPIINENDTVMTDEITVGDNDTLAAQVAKLIGADLLVLLTTVDGLLDGSGQVVSHVALDDDPASLVSSGTSGVGRGGMGSKLEAAAAASHGGIEVVIANGRTTGVLAAAVAGQSVGTRFEVDGSGLPSRKHWIAYTLKACGALHLDTGAATAVRGNGASVLPVGIKQVDGDFAEGEAVTLVAPDGTVLGRGLARQSAQALRAVIGAKGPPAVHRDDLVIDRALEPTP